LARPKYAPDEEGRLFAAFNEYGEHLAAITPIVLKTPASDLRKSTGYQERAH